MRTKSGVVSKKRHKKILKLTKGYYGRSKNCYRLAKNRLEKGLQYSYRDRKNKKREIRSLCIQRINAAIRNRGQKYSVFMHTLKQKNIPINRNSLAEMIWHGHFDKFCESISL